MKNNNNTTLYCSKKILKIIKLDESSLVNKPLSLIL